MNKKKKADLFYILHHMFYLLTLKKFRQIWTREVREGTEMEFKNMIGHQRIVLEFLKKKFNQLWITQTKKNYFRLFWK